MCVNGLLKKFEATGDFGLISGTEERHVLKPEAVQAIVEAIDCGTCDQN